MARQPSTGDRGDVVALTGTAGLTPPPAPRRPSLVPPAWSANETYQVAMRIPLAGVACIFSTAITNPVDVIKVRQQLRINSTLPSTFWQVGRSMVVTEGWRSLTNGVVAGMMREAIYGTIRLGTYEYFKETWAKVSNGTLSERGLPLKVISSITAATLGASLANPTDLVKIRLQAPYPLHLPPPYTSTAHAFRTVYAEGGIPALWRGTTPTVVRGIVISVSQIVGYDHAKQTLKYTFGWREGMGVHLAASLFAGLFCSITSNPVDVVKVRMMNDSTHTYRGVFNCFTTILRTEGPFAFYKGFMMCWARLGTHTVVTYLIYERLRLLAGVRPI